MVLVQNVVASAAVVLLVMLNRSVECISNSKTTSSPSSHDGAKDLKTEGTSFWNPQPEYYDRDRYSRPDRTDFVTSYGGSNENKYGGSTTASYGSKDRFGYGPFSTTGTGSGSTYFTSGGIYDRNKPLHYGPPQPVEYTHDYDAHYDYNSQGHGYSLGHHPYGSGKDIAKSVLIPLAGAALLGIAAALVANPVLLHLGVAAGKKRKRRNVVTYAHNLAYRAQLKKPPT